MNLRNEIGQTMQVVTPALVSSDDLRNALKEISVNIRHEITALEASKSAFNENLDEMEIIVGDTFFLKEDGKCAVIEVIKDDKNPKNTKIKYISSVFDVTGKSGTIKTSNVQVSTFKTRVESYIGVQDMTSVLFLMSKDI